MSRPNLPIAILCNKYGSHRNSVSIRAVSVSYKHDAPASGFARSNHLLARRARIFQFSMKKLVVIEYLPTVAALSSESMAKLCVAKQDLRIQNRM